VNFVSAVIPKWVIVNISSQQEFGLSVSSIGSDKKKWPSPGNIFVTFSEVLCNLCKLCEFQSSFNSSAVNWMNFFCVKNFCQNPFCRDTFPKRPICDAKPLSCVYSFV